MEDNRRKPLVVCMGRIEKCVVFQSDGQLLEQACKVFHGIIPSQTGGVWKEPVRLEQVTQACEQAGFEYLSRDLP